MLPNKKIIIIKIGNFVMANAIDGNLQEKNSCT